MSQQGLISLNVNDLMILECQDSLRGWTIIKVKERLISQAQVSMDADTS